MEVQKRSQQETLNLDFSLPPFAEQCFDPYRYKVFCGGRGKGATWTTGRMALMRSLQQKTRILCTRELQKSISDSTHQLFKDQISLLGLDAWFDVTNNEITNRIGSNFIYKGLKHNAREIKSLEGIDIVLVEEAEKVSEESWKFLIPTIRKNNSEIWINLNPDLETDPTYVRFVKNAPPRTLLLNLTYRDNPYFPEVLREEMEYLKSVDYDAYLNVWEGQPRQNSDAQIMNGKWEIAAFEFSKREDGWYLGDVKAEGPYFGLDFGFSVDPTALVRCFIVGTRLYIDHEIYKIKLETVDLPDLIKTVPDTDKRVIRADSARPETISHLNNLGGLNVVGVEKGKGSVEDGITFLRSFEKIVIHDRCRHMAQEARLYSFKTDRLTGDVTTDILDKHNHLWDAVRYALEPLIKKSGKGMGLFYLLQQQAAEKQAREAKNVQQT